MGCGSDGRTAPSRRSARIARGARSHRHPGQFPHCLICRRTLEMPVDHAAQSDQALSHLELDLVRLCDRCSPGQHFQDAARDLVVGSLLVFRQPYLDTVRDSANAPYPLDCLDRLVFPYG